MKAEASLFMLVALAAVAGEGPPSVVVAEGEAFKPLAVWEDGSAAVTVHEVGKGKAFAVGTMAGAAYVKTGLRKVPYARGGRHAVYNPTELDPAAAKLAWLGVAARPLARDARCSNPLVEAIVMDHAEGTLVTLVNWTNSPLKALTVQVKVDKAPRSVRSVEGQKELPAQFNESVVAVTTDLNEADYILLMK